MLMAISAGLGNWLGHEVYGAAPTLYVDLELGEEDQVRRARQISKGLGLREIPETFYYLGGTGRSPEEVFTAAYRDCEELGVKVMLVDSVGLALLGDASNYKDVISFHRECLDVFSSHLGVTPILIDHQANLQAGENYQNKSAYGNSYKNNLTRSRIQVELKDRGKSSRGVILRQMKVNLGAEADPFAVLIDFETEGVVTITRRDLGSEEIAEETVLPLKDRILATLVDEPLYPSAIAEATGAPTQAVSVATKKLRDAQPALVERTGNQEANAHELRITTTGLDHYRRFVQLNDLAPPIREDEVIKSPPAAGSGGTEPSTGTVQESF